MNYVYCKVYSYEKNTFLYFVRVRVYGDQLDEIWESQFRGKLKWEPATKKTFLFYFSVGQIQPTGGPCNSLSTRSRAARAYTYVEKRAGGGDWTN
jgi:hypothetical protein